MTLLKKHRNILLVFFLILLIKLILLPFSQNTDSDAVTRIYMSMDWMHDPRWILSSIWGPFHFYLNGIFLMFWNDPVLVPSLINIFLSCLTLFPFYFFCKREFNEKGALIATLLFGFSPLLFRNSFMGLSETPFLFLLAHCLNFLSKGLKENDPASFRHLALAGFFITLASGFRYESWLLIAVLSVLVLLRSNFRNAFIFGAVASLFPIIWMVQNYLDQGNAFYSLQGNYTWTMNVMHNNEGLSLESYLRRLWFFPFSWLISAGPVAAFIILQVIGRSWKTRRDKQSVFNWSLPFLVLLLFFEYNSFKGTLLLQHRFTGTLTLLSFPFLAAFFNERTTIKNRTAWAAGILMVGLSYCYNMKGISPLSRLSDQRYAEISGIVNKNIHIKSGLIVDFIDWEHSYYIALESRLDPRDLVLVYNYVPAEQIQQLIREHENGVLLLKKNSELFDIFRKDSSHPFSIDDDLKIESVFENEEVIVIKWEKK